jgi:hypothetical protein
MFAARPEMTSYLKHCHVQSGSAFTGLGYRQNAAAAAAAAALARRIDLNTSLTSGRNTKGKEWFLFQQKNGSNQHLCRRDLQILLLPVREFSKP